MWKKWKCYNVVCLVVKKSHSYTHKDGMIMAIQMIRCDAIQTHCASELKLNKVYL